MADVGLMNDEDDDMMELEDLDDEESDNESESENAHEEETEQEVESEQESANPVPEVTGPQQAQTAENKPGLKEKFLEKRGQVDNLFDKGMTGGRKLYDKHKDKAYSIYDKIMDFKDDIHDEGKSTGKGFVRSAASVVGKKIKGTETFQKMANSKVGNAVGKVGNAVGKVGNAIGTGANALKEKVSNSKLGKWVAKKKAEREAKKDEPGIFSKISGKVKTGAGALKEKAQGSKLGQWIAKKKAEREPKKGEPGMFSKLMGKMKTGAGVIKEKVKNSKPAQWIAEKKAKFFTKMKTGAGALKDKVMNSKPATWAKGKIHDVKEFIDEQKAWLDEKKERLMSFKDDVADELDDHEFDRKMNHKARNGDPGYKERYYNLVDELQQNEELMHLKGTLSGQDIAQALNDLESGKQEDEQKTSASDKLGKVGDLSSKIGEKLGGDRVQGFMKERLGGTAAKFAPLGFSEGGALMKSAASGIDAFKAGKKANEIKKEKEDLGDDKRLQRAAQYAEDESKKQSVTSGFGVAENLITAGKILEKATTGNDTFTKMAEKGVKATKFVVTSKMDKKSIKGGLKGLLGGVEGYKALKTKYRLQAPEMRRAIREAIGVATEKDVANADKKDLSREMAERMANNDEKTTRLGKVLGGSNAKSLNRAMGGTEEKIKQKTYKRGVAPT